VTGLFGIAAPPLSVTVACSCPVLPTFRGRLLGLTAIAAGIWCTVMVAVSAAAPAAATMRAVPTVFAVTLPLVPTVATVGLRLVHTNVAPGTSLPLESFAVAVS
jgi:hypothetical protein